VKTWDVIILGGGIIGVSLARELRKHGAHVIVVERGQPGREASYASAGMLAPFGSHMPDALAPLARASAQMFPEFVHELEDESGERVDLRTNGAIVTADEADERNPPSELSESELRSLEPNLAYRPGLYFAQESSVDPRALIWALVAAAKHRNVHFASGFPVMEVAGSGGRVSVKTERSAHVAPAVVNCCGAWSATVVANGEIVVPVRPVKGQMLCLAGPRRDFLKHSVRSAEAYLVPRSDGRILVGATIEEAGFDKRVEPEVMQRFHQVAANFAPDLGEARMLEAWAGLRPATADNLPVLGKTPLPGYFVASGHFRNGVLLAPVTAAIMANVVRGLDSPFDIRAFSLKRLDTPEQFRPIIQVKRA
jgi:glycine oxidase